MYLYKFISVLFFTSCWISPVLTQSTYYTFSPDSLEGSTDFLFSGEDDIGPCPKGTYFSYQLCVECPSGHICPGNVSAPRRCPAGTFNLYPGKSSVKDCKSCLPGLISSEDRVDCRLCPAGFACDPDSGSLSPCPPGLHSPEGPLQCLACPLGSVCPSGYPLKCGPGKESDQNQTKCVDCLPGFYSTLCSAHCFQCPAGSHCPGRGTSRPLPCPPGQFSLPGQSACRQCNGTSWQCGGAAAPRWSLTGSRAAQRPSTSLLTCRPGTYRDPGDEGTDCLTCPLGHYCVGGSAVSCPAGTYGPKEGLQRLTDCPPCPAGFYCLEGSTRRPGAQFLCPQGYYCEEGTATPHGSPCPTGTAGTQLGQTSRAACKRCAEGRFCPTGSADPGLPCARGRFCPAGTMEEVVCPQGTFTPHQGMISVKGCLKCPAGFYCPEGTSDPVPCHPGTFNPLEGQDDVADCRDCYPGKACTKIALRAPDEQCMQGFVCPPGSSKPNALANACPPGTLSDRTDLTDRSQCQLCPARYACLRGTGGVQRPPLSCFPGHYCPPGTMFPTQYKCPVGTWSGRSGLETESECQVCPRGWYCLAGSGAPSGRCGTGHYCPEGTIYGSQFPCPVGTYSIRMGNGHRNDCLVCPEGSYCPEGTSKPAPCPPSTFRAIKGGQRLEDCSACPAGYFCPLSATVRPRACGAGSYSDESSEQCLPCLRGHYCSNETTSEETMLSVMVCPAGFLCSQGLARDPQRSATLCPRGFYCPGGAIDPDPVPCPNGTYSDSPGLRDITECVQCPRGQYCYSSQPWEQPITQPTGACPDGHHCPLGTGYPYTFPCQPGQYRNNTHSHGGEVCVSCPSRNYCRRPGTHTPASCPVGFYCPEGSAAPEPCPEGTYSSRAALSSISECSPCGGGRYCIGVGLTEPSGSCAEGFYCREGAKSATPANGPTGGLCPIGSYCVAGSSFPSPCPPGTFSNSVGLTTQQQCVRCPPGYYCSGYNNTAPSGPCLPGFYCTGGSAWPVQHDAEEGHFTLEGAVRAIPCPLGTFQPGRGGQSCVQCAGGRLCNQTGLSRPPLCPTGHYCPRGATVARPCPPGTYADEAGGEDVQHCRPCDAGWFCSRAALSQPQGLCNPGHYCIMGASTGSPALGVSTGGVCPAGFVCPSGTKYPRQYPCPAGTWSSTMGARDLTSNCVPCPPGLYCNSTGLRQPSGACGAGYYCSERATTPMPSDGVTGDRCPVGHYCPPGSASPVPCPDGQHSNVTGAAECEDCPPGTYCLSGEGVQLCPAGHYCLGGSVEAILPCPPGTYSPERALSQVEQCLICPAGLYCEEWGLYEPTGPCQAGYFCLAGINFRNPDGNFSTGVGGACPQGHYCPEGTGLPVPCPLGTYSNSLYVTEVGGCMWCPAGHFCGSVGLIRPSGPCHEGFYCPGGDSAATGSEGAGRMCPAAHYCPGGSASPMPCPAGTYATLTGQTHCSHCPAGHYCPESTAHFTQFPCPPGHYCLDGTRHATQFPCPRGYYNPEPMTQSLDSCLPCPPGHYCEKERLASVSGKCNAGWFCVSAAWTSQPFDLDNYTNANCLCPATSTGGRCQEGFYCPSGSSEPLPCPPGTFCNTSGLALPTGPCSPGYFCIEGATEPRPSDGDTGSICPPGTYCGESSEDPELCPAGTFSPVPGLSSEDGCRPCTAGFYCARQGLRTPTGSCSQGYWCPPGQTVPMGTPCPPRYSCPQGSAAPQPCPPGTYQDQEKQPSCDVCRAGYYCDLSVAPANASALRPCPIGHYCPAGTVLASENPCPTGTFNPRERTHDPSDCMSCPPGQHCPDMGLSAPAGPCHAGYWCKEGAVSPTPLDGVTGFPCPPGQYCPSGTPAPLACPEGRWSNTSGLRRHEDCQPCPGGHYCHSAGLSTPTGLCTGGYYCVRGSVTSTPTDGTIGGPCPEGHHCPQGTTLPVPCDPGTYMTVTHATQCEVCLPGWHCVSGALYLCPAGFYCPEGTGYDVRGCPVGTYSPEAGLWAASQCQPCDGGHYCSSTNATAVTGPCQRGHYCSRGSASPRPVSQQHAGEGGPCPAGHYCPPASSQPMACPRGTFSNLTQLVSQEDCQPCVPGYYCDALGLTAPPGACWEGFYCVGGSQRPDPPSRDSRGGPCPRGHYCVEGSSAPLECPRGTISVEESQAFCSPCPQGSYCPSGNGSLSQSSVCPVGHYCPTGTGDGHRHPCPAGSVNPHTSMSQPEDCLPCPAGSFCAWPGQAQVTGQCDAGYYCRSAARSSTPQDGGLTGDRCPEGHYCPQGTSVPFPCPLGHYSNKTRDTQISDCLICPPGSYCPHRQSSSQPASLQCLPGNMCPPGSARPAPCMPGAYQDLAGQAECMTCPAGSYCPGRVDVDTGRASGTVSPVPCPQGHYCPPGTQSAVAFPCPAGTLAGQMGVSGEAGCEPCPPGKYCSSSGLASPTGDCSPGYICIQGSVHPQPEGGRCPPGSYCPLGSGYMSPCPVGTFNNIEGNGTSLLPLPGGDSDARQPQTHGGGQCPAGHYCPEGSATPSLCPPGSFLGRSEAESEAECEACSPGFYCPSWAQTSADELCPEGWFCPPGSVSGHQPEYQCPPGHECPRGSAEPAICSPGTFQASSGQPACDSCPPGFYCMEGTSVPWACPRGSVNAVAGRTSLSDCSPCPPGSFCNSTALAGPSGPCSPGHFCTLGAIGPSPVSQPYGDVCPAGHFCPEASSSAERCPAGSYLSQPGASARTHCQPCPPGSYCLTAGASQPTGPCSPGFYCSLGSDSPEPRSNSSLISCLCGSMGFYTTEPDPCLWKHNLSCSDSPTTSGFDAGWVEIVPGSPWSELCQNVTTTASCLMGTHHACATFRGDVCPRGFYCPSGSAVPQPCDAGSHCNRSGLHAPAGPCHEGYLCPRGSADPHASLCPTGHYCPRGSPVPLPCPPGTMKSFAGGSGVEACEECPQGYYCQQSGLARPSGRCAEGYHCPQGQTSNRPHQHVCSAGHYCEKGSARQTACVPGSYQPSDGQDSCEPCPAGFYCQHQGMEVPVPCERGFYCPSGSAGQHPCPAGTYSNHSGLVAEHQCSPCSPGMYCRGPGRTSPSGPCSAGFVCLGGASEPSPLDNLTGSPCPPGFFCPEKTSTPRPCPKGTFSESSGLVEAYQCHSCSPGFHCSAPGLSAVSGPCLPGFYCLEGSQSSTPVFGASGGVCPAGHYCESGTSVPAPCPAGTYQNRTGGKTQDSCTPCPHGWFQYLSGQRECNACPPGFHCQTPPSTTSNDSWSSTGASSPLPCPPGYICPGEIPERPPAPCPLGTYSSTLGLTTTGECVACPAGQFCGSEGLMGPSGPCAAGFLCLTGATIPNPRDNITGSPCPPGVFCQKGLISGECWPGFYCDWGSSRPDQSLCPVGFFCPKGTPSALACPAGTFSADPGLDHQDHCIICPAAYYCLGEGTVQPTLCPAGHYCPPGLVLGVEFPCPSGTVQGQPGASSLGACLPCPAGMFCSLPGLSEPTGQCEAGYFCLAGSTSPNALDYQGNSSRTNLCPVGHYCPAGTGYPLPCPAGTLSTSLGLRGIEECPPCPPGLFCDRPALAELSDALPCHAGYVCQGGSSTATPIDRKQGYLCPVGHSCPAGSAVEVPCVPGTYSAALGAAHCDICPSGSMCPSTGTEEPGVCGAGHFCPAGTARPLPCPPGTFSNQTGAHSESVCTACPTGFYCSTYGASMPEGPCQQGYFCHGGASAPTPESSEDFPRNGPCPVGHYCPSGSLTPLPCPIGSIRNSTGGVSVEGCSGCPTGHYCSTEGLASPTGPCAAGFYCPFDVSSTTPHTFLCPKGHFCPEGSPLALPCPTGEYQPNTGSDGCIPCRPGFYCEEAVVGDPLPCPPHSFCPAATMVPQPCPHGTYTKPQQRGLQEERECLACPPGKYCRAGKVQGVCAAGYLCLSGSASFTPQGHVSNWSYCEWKMQCAGTCPPGFFCPEGALRAEPCPVNTIRQSPGGASLQDCLPCPPQHWCKAGDPVLYLCPAGHYCDGYGASAGPRECPYYTYRALPGAGSKGDCLPCPPGTHCNSTGLTDYSSKPCPPGYWCSGTGRPILCPAGTKRPLPGGAAPGQCEPCTGGTYCPDPRTTGQPNVEGIPCRASYQCPPGAVSEKLCRAGSYCGPQTAEPKVCPAGYFCPQGSHTYNVPKQLVPNLHCQIHCLVNSESDFLCGVCMFSLCPLGCPFPYYCPANSSHMRSCDGGSMPVKINGLRVSKDSCCVACEGGTYRPYLSPFLQCFPCPAGYHCPPGADLYRSNPCPLGHVCPVGSSSPVPCPPGTFGNLDRAERTEDCQPCPAGTFNHLAAQKACFPCGSSSTATAGSSSCTCIGKNRAFQHSDGSCLCRTGFIFYNQLDFKISTADSEQDCQPEVNRRCVTGEVRLAATRECVSPNLYDCNVTCGAHGGTLDVEMGICQCERYVSAEELCNTSCMARLPQLSGQLSPDGQLLLNLGHRDHARGWARNVMDVIGPDIHVKNFGKIHFVQFDPQGVYGWILKDRTLINYFLSDPVELLDKIPRKKTDTGHVDAVSSSGLPRIPNPIACISSSDMLIFQLTINHTDRHLSHFPVYQKDHLFNSNPSWDFGAFRHLETLMKQTHFNSTRFAHVFSERGKYVFVDSAVPQWSMVVVVSERGTECDPRAPSFQPMTPAQLVRFGIVKEHRLNLLPDWELITGVLSVLLVVVVLVTTTVLVMRPNKAKLISQWRARPRWRSLGEPIPLTEYLYNGDSLDGQMQTGLLGSRGEGEGAEAEEPAVSKGAPPLGRCDLEEFNVKTLYDKLEDQNLHLASQLARHRKHTQDFYRNICQQTDAVRNILENMDSKKLNVLKELLERDTMRSKASSSGVGDRDAQALLGAVLRSVEAVLNRLSGECWQSQDLQCELHPGDTRTTDTHMGSAQFSPTNMTKTEAPPTDSGHAQSTCLSEQDLSKLVAMSPLSRTLQEIQQSLQNLTTDQPVITEAPMEDDPGSLIPVALDTLSPQHSAVFLFGCQVMCLLGKCPLFPPVLLLLARSLPGSHCPSGQGLLAHCLGDFYFDSSNQILYLSEAKLQHVGEFISTILQSMAYVASGSRVQSFMQALHQGISAVGLHLFNSSFTWDSTKQTKCDAAEGSHSPLVEDFLNVRVPTEELFTERLLAGRLQQYKCFKLEQLIGDLKQWPSRQNGKGLSPKGTPVQMSCIEQEIDRLNESFLDLSVQLEKRVQINTWQREREHSAASQAKSSSSPEALPSLSRSGTVVLELRRRYVLQRLDELQLALGRIREHREVEEGVADPAAPINGSDTQQQENINSIDPGSPTSEGETSEGGGVDALEVDSSEAQAQLSDEAVQRSGPETSLAGDQPPPPAESRGADVTEEREVDRDAAGPTHTADANLDVNVQ